MAKIPDPSTNRHVTGYNNKKYTFAAKYPPFVVQLISFVVLGLELSLERWKGTRHPYKRGQLVKAKSGQQPGAPYGKTIALKTKNFFFRELIG